jgi:Trypsin-co-occurring domain 1
MPKLTPIQFDDNTIIYIETTEDLDIPIISTKKAGESIREEEESLTSRGISEDLQKQTLQNFRAIQNTIYTYTTFTLGALKQIKNANISKVKLEFGIEIGGELGIPYITKGTAKSNLKINVECSLREESTE